VASASSTACLSLPERDGKDYSSNQIMLDIAQDSFMAPVYRTVLIVALQEFFGRAEILCDTLTLAECCQKEWPSPSVIR
jgi:hypothetical protein